MVGQKVAAFIYFAILTKIIGVGGTGEYFLATSIIMLMSTFFDLGTTPLLIREWSREAVTSETRNGLLKAIVKVKAIAMLPGLALAALVPFILGYDTVVVHLVLIGLPILFLDSIALTSYGIIRSMQELKYEAIGMVLSQLTIVAVGTAGLYATGSVLWAMIALLSGSIFNAILSSTVAGRVSDLAIRGVQTLNMRSLLSSAIPFFLAAVFVKVYSYIDSIIISQVLGTAATGIYAVAYKLTYAFQFIPLAFVAALYPALSKKNEKGGERAHHMRTSFEYMALVAFPIVFGIAATAPDLIKLYSSAEFIAAAPILTTLVFVLIPIFFDFPLGSLLNASNRQTAKTSIMGVTMVINVAANLILVPMIGIMGAAIAALVSFSFMLVADWIYVRDIIGLTEVDVMKVVWPYLLASVAMSAAVRYMDIQLPFEILIGAVVFAALVLVLRPKFVLSVVKSLWKKSSK
jgi:O-antigen/teichoic acid export membrane protein